MLFFFKKLKLFLHFSFLKKLKLLCDFVLCFIFLQAFMFKKEAMTFHNEVLQILLKIFTFNKTSLKFQAFFEV